MSSAAEFLVQFPEFAQAPPALVAAKLADAVARTSTEAFSASAIDRHVYLLCARLLALSPFGRDMRLVADDNVTVYDADLLAMARTATVGIGRVC